MGFFRKKQITTEELAEHLAAVVMHSVSEGSLPAYQMLLEDIGEDTRVTETQKKEILILNLLAMSRAIQKAFAGNALFVKTLTDSVFENVYKTMQMDSEQTDSFEDLIHKRFAAYYEILSSQSEFMAHSFGKEFADHFLNQDSAEAHALIATASDLFMLEVESLEEFISQMTEKYDLKV